MVSSALVSPSQTHTGFITPTKFQLAYSHQLYISTFRNVLSVWVWLVVHRTYVYRNSEAKVSNIHSCRRTHITNMLNPIVSGLSGSSQIPSLSCSQAGPSAAMCQKVPASPGGGGGGARVIIKLDDSES